jgi:hypothetical protein
VPTIADYRVIEAGSLSFPGVPFLPPPLGADIDHDFDAFNAPAVDAGTRSILFFRLEPEGDCEMEWTLNGTTILTRSLGAGPERSMHVAVPRGLVQASNNGLRLTAFGLGDLTVSEVILFFQAAI